ncbi:MAG TPA: hypothetical protein PLI27_06275 [Ignavibacteriales bacterium]|nr:hypothetical protein [Ignavibacteriales bacterium]HOL80884.1 hypothetical protein [Ignavibacteriales bacterium]HOM65908.1 hypothetical protein [Ignavibacteriales bacterium]HPD67664.1 hypothetical protein [Ignavibacteriales bacterium]HPP33319.1 hypothetical protein [Ignavibacteriales bacterium]
MKFLDGTWLENYIFSILFEHLQSNNYKVYKNLEFIKEKETNKNKKFKIDCIVLKEYQIIGISCTTEKSIKLCKMKAFEVYYRTKQIGGTQTKNILVSFAKENTAKELQEELAIDTGSDKSNILILGYKDFEPLISKEKFLNFINETK